MAKRSLILKTGFFAFFFCLSLNQLRADPGSTLNQSETPIIFARINADAPLERFGKLQAGLCYNSHLFNSQDICSPKPLSVGQILDKAGSDPFVWKLPQTPKLIYWQQSLEADEILTIELIDGDGMPWPTSTAISKNKDQFLVKIKISYELPKGKDFLLTGCVHSKTQKKDTWLMPLSVQMGSTKKPIWDQVTKKKKRSKKLRKKRYRKKRKK